MLRPLIDGRSRMDSDTELYRLVNEVEGAYHRGLLDEGEFRQIFERNVEALDRAAPRLIYVDSYVVKRAFQLG